MPVEFIERKLKTTLPVHLVAKDRLDAAGLASSSLAWAKANGIRPENITLGEFGMIRQEYGNAQVMPAEYRAAYVRDMIARAEAHGFSWSVWSYGGAFGIVEAFDGDKAEPDVLDAIKSLH
ncbi:MAG: hypothetical protein E5V18_09670 [Mesorhizobium sp.]|nr:MAG: hypothetical protein E5V18_09670 [Mesorhizobium sp.]